MCDLGHFEPTANQDGLICEPCAVGSWKNWTGPDNCTLCDAGMPETEAVGTLNATQCFAGDGEEWYEQPEIIVPVVLGPFAMLSGGSAAVFFFRGGREIAEEDESAI